MKKIIFIFSALYLLFQVTAIAQPRCTWRMNNPRLIYSAPDDFLEFDIEMMCDSASRYFSGMTIVMNVNLQGAAIASGITDPIVFTYGPTYQGLNGSGNPKYSMNATFPSTTRMSLASTVGSGGGLQPGGPLYFSEIPTIWHKWGTVKVKITNSSLYAGMNFRVVSFGVGAFRRLGSATPIPFLTPHIIDTKDFYRLCLGRIYNNVTGWTQYGGTLSWLSGVNTSVWDGTGTTNVYGGLVNKVRIHGASAVAGANQVATLSGGTLQILPGSSIQAIDSTFIETPRGLIIGSSSGMAQFLDNGNFLYGSGASAQTYIQFTQDKWHMYSIPLTSTVSLPYDNIYMKYYQEPTDHWKYVQAQGFNPDTTLNTPMLGYALWASSTGTYTNPGWAAPFGTLNTGNKSISVTRTNVASIGGFNGWNLVGNPYASAIDLSNVAVAWGSVDQSAHFWNGSQYLTYVKAGGGTRNSNSPFVAAQQAFFVHTSGNSAFGITNAARTVNAEPFLKESDYSNDFLKLEAVSGVNGTNDLANIILSQGTELTYEPGVDAYKLRGNLDAPQLWSSYVDDEFTVNVLPFSGNQQIVPLNFYCELAGNYTINATNVESFTNKHVYLVDKKTGNTQELNLNPVYPFSYAAGEDESRFEIHFVTYSLGVNDPENSAMKIYSNDVNLYVANVSEGIQHGKVDLYDMSGRKIFTSELQNNKISKFNPNVIEGYYAVSVITDKGIYTGKVYLK